jgi:hypothetical protein
MSCEGHNPENTKLKAPIRNRFFYGKLLDEFHLCMETKYQNDKRWLLNRLSLGHGVLCGLIVSLSPDGKQICVSSGMAIDAWGREIIVPEPFCFDPWKDPDPACGTAETLDRTKPVYLCLAYRECLTNPVPVLVTDCEAKDQTQCDSIVEGYKWILSNTAPESEWPNKPSEALCAALKAENAIERLKALCEVFAGDQCQPSDKPPCVMLAKIELNVDDKTIVSIDNCSVRPFVVSNETLFEMILCLAGAASGTNGKDGLGLYADLPKILDIQWIHNHEYSLDQIFFPYLSDPSPLSPGTRRLVISISLNDFQERLKLIQINYFIPLFTIYFNRKVEGVDLDTFNVSFKFKLPQNSSPISISENFDLDGYILQIENNFNAVTPHTEEIFKYAITFVPLLPREFTLEGGKDYPWSDFKHTDGFHIKLKGDFIWAINPNGDYDENFVLDADNIGGRVGGQFLRKPPILGGKNPSGNLTQGGDFEGWIRNADRIGRTDDNQLNNLNHRFVSGNDLFGSKANLFPVNVNSAELEGLVTVGFSKEQAAKILKDRGIRPFKNKADFTKRMKITNDLNNVLLKISF